MQYIDMKFKERNPVETVNIIKEILDNIGLEVFETWLDSGIDNCWSLQVAPHGGVPFSNGKGITKELARASAYGEFIERLQGGLFFYKHQSIIRDSDMNIQSFAPDAKYMTMSELIADGEWMDYIIRAYGGNISRESIAKQCMVYDCSIDGKILTLPFYSLFEDKYVYLPISFVDQIFATNGCCVGNSKSEAWVHALSEIMERHATLNILTKGHAAPVIPDEILEKFPVVSKIIADIKDSGDIDIEIFDFSTHEGFPVISTRIINKNTHSYVVNVAADPVLEIAIQRTLTEIFQGRTIRNFCSSHTGEILGSVDDYPLQSNIINQLETGNGLFTADFFAEEITCKRSVSDFPDNSQKNNDELLQYMLSLYRKNENPVYVRNFSYLGFSCYRFVVPGFSEAFATKLSRPISEFALADQACTIMKDVANASDADLSCLLTYNKMIASVFSRYNNFGRLSGVPITGNNSLLLACVTRAYAAYRLGKYSDSLKYVEPIIKSKKQDESTKEYIKCVKMYIQLKQKNISEEKIKIILPKFFKHEHFNRVFRNLDEGTTPYDDFLLKCDLRNCLSCRYVDSCHYNSCKSVITTAGKYYTAFVHGQNRDMFSI